MFFSKPPTVVALKVKSSSDNHADTVGPEGSRINKLVDFSEGIVVLIQTIIQVVEIKEAGLHGRIC